MLQFFSWLVGCKTARSFCVGQEREQLNERFQARNQDFIWGGANETKVDQTTEMYILLSDPFI